MVFLLFLSFKAGEEHWTDCFPKGLSSSSFWLTVFWTSCQTKLTFHLMGPWQVRYVALHMIIGAVKGVPNSCRQTFFQTSSSHHLQGLVGDEPLPVSGLFVVVAKRHALERKFNWGHHMTSTALWIMQLRVNILCVKTHAHLVFLERFFVRKLHLESVISLPLCRLVRVTASCRPAAEGGKAPLFLHYIMTAALHYHAENTACIPLPQLGIVLGYNVTHCTSGLVPNMGSVGYLQGRATALQSTRLMGYRTWI